MQRVKSYFSAWDFSRYFRLALGVALAIGYASTKENIYLMGAILLIAQALLNMGCGVAGGCSTRVPDKSEPVMKIDKYEPKPKNDE